MTTKLLTMAGLLVTLANTSSALDLINNGSFESGTSGWMLPGPAKYSLTNWAYSGVSALVVTNRSNFTNAPRQNVTAALASAGGSSNWTTRFAVSVAVPTTVRAWLQVDADNGSGLQTSRYLLAERVLRVTNQWTLVSGTKTIAWQGTLSSATFYTEVGMRQEPTAGGIAYPICVLDGFNVKPDADADGLWDDEEVSVASGGTGTDPMLKDTDGDGLPDGWEVAQGLDANSASGANGANGDADGDGFTNWQEFWGDTQPNSSASFPGQPCHANLTESARAVLTYLALLPSRTTNRVIAGQHLTDIDLEWTNQVVALHTQTGSWPGLVSFAGEFGATATLQMNVVEPRVIEVWTNGAIPLVKWQMPSPWSGSGTSPTGGENIPEMLNPATTLATNQVARSNYLAWRDTMADSLARLRDAGVVVLFRPFSEMNGSWFWHGNKPRSHYVALWRDLHAYYTTSRGLTNLLWVFEPDSSVHLASSPTTSGTPIDYYYPGDDVVDVVGHNFYDNDWLQPFDSDAVWRGHGKVFAVPQAGSDTIRDGTWDNLYYLNGVTNSIPRVAFFCAWNTFTSGGGTSTNHNAIIDNLNPSSLLTNPLVATRSEIDWQYYLDDMRVDYVPQTGAMLEFKWQGGLLQESTDLINWTDVANATRPRMVDTTTGTRLFIRVRK